MKATGHTDFSSFISVQPFWKISQTDTCILYNESGKAIAHVFNMRTSDTVLDCVPGIGLITLIFSNNPENPMVYCYGSIEKRRRGPLNGISDAFVCRLFPGEFTRIFGIPACDLTNIETPLENLIPIGSVAEEMACAKSFTEQQAVILRLLRPRHENEKFKSTQALTRQALCEIFNSRGDVRIKELEQQSGYSSRYLHQVLLANVGLSPKQVCSHVRFQNALRLLNGRGVSNVVAVAQQTGFYDQSHFNRVFQKYVEMSPEDYLHFYSPQKTVQLRYGQKI